MLLNLTEYSTERLATQIVRQVAEKILAGDLATGTALPSARTLARQQHVSVETVKDAYQELVACGLLLAHGEAGPTVAALTPEQQRDLQRQLTFGRQTQLQAIESFSRELLAVFDAERIRRLLRTSLQESLQATSVQFAMADEDQEYVILPDNTEPMPFAIARHDAFLKKLHEHITPVVLADAPPAGGASSLWHELRRRKIKLVYALRDTDRFLGFVALGAKATGSTYTDGDHNLLMVLANQYVTALITARLYVEAVEKRRLQEELDLARRIQRNLLPGALPDDAEVQMAAISEPSRTVGGDFYDFLDLGEQRFGVVIADACGKGMPAAILISQIQAILKNEITHGTGPAAVMSLLNQHVKRYAAADTFTTLFFGIFERPTRTLQYANAGHNFPLLVSRQGRVEALGTTGPALGLLASAAFRTETVMLGRGDVLLLYSDGVTETMNLQQEEFGDERLKAVLVRQRLRSASEILTVIQQELDRYQSGHVLQDDRTMLVLKVREERLASAGAHPRS